MYVGMIDSKTKSCDNVHAIIDSFENNQNNVKGGK